MSEPADEQADLASGLSQLATLLLSVEDAEEALQHLARMAVVVVPDGPTCGITVRRRGQYVTIVHEGFIPASVHEAQYAIGQGPCLQALRTGSPVVAQDLAAEHRWGDFPRQALAAGAHGACAFPLEADGQVVGALNLYAHEPGLFPEPVQRIAAQFVEPASILLAGVLHRLSQAEMITQLHAALASRGVIDQAIGIIIAYRHCSPEHAFQILRKVSNDRNIKLRVVAADVVRAASKGEPRPLGARLRYEQRQRPPPAAVTGHEGCDQHQQCEQHDSQPLARWGSNAPDSRAAVPPPALNTPAPARKNRSRTSAVNTAVR